MSKLETFLQTHSLFINFPFLKMVLPLHYSPSFIVNNAFLCFDRSSRKSQNIRMKKPQIATHHAIVK